MSEMSTKERLLSLQNFVNSQIGEELNLTEGIKKLAEQGGGKDTFDIFWHGDAVGWADGFNTNYQSNKQSAAISISKGQLYRSKNSNANLFLKNRPFTRGKYTKLKFIVESLEGNTGKYNHLTIGFRRASEPVYTSYTGGLTYFYRIVNHENSTNIAGTSPWYTLPFGEYELDITDVPEDEEVILGFDCCDNGFRFYSIWLE